MTDTIALVGSGQLYAALVRSLGERCVSPPSAAAMEGCAALVTATDLDDVSVYPEAGTSPPVWLPVRVERHRVLLGPSVLPTEPGCPTCAARRRDGNRPDAQAHGLLRRSYGDDLVVTPSPLLTPLLAWAVAALVTDELDRLLAGLGSARTRGAMLSIAPATASARRHLVLPDPLCPRCAVPRQDGPDDVWVRPRPLPKRGVARFRLTDLSVRYDELRRLYVDPETGVIASLGRDSQGGIPIAVARLSPGTAVSDSQHGYGRADDFRSAELTAITEALERLSSAHARDHGTAVRASYAEVAERAVDPRILGLYPDAWYDRPGFGFRRFCPDRPTRWVWGYSFARAEPLLIPETVAYYRSGRPDDPGFAMETSNGCALGACLEEAILYGLLEVAERDAFLLAWYTRTPFPRVELSSARDRHIPLLAELIRERDGYQVMAFATVLEQRVPAFWAMAVDRGGVPGRPRVVCAAAAHPDAEHALRGALRDLGSILHAVARRYRPEIAHPLVLDAERVTTMPQHSLLYGHPAAHDRLSFLPVDEPGRPLSTVSELAAWPRHDDLGADLAELVGRYLASGMDVLAVDTTSPEQRRGGFAAAKVIVPGTLPMTFGHRWRRTHGIPRLSSVPVLLGFRAAEPGGDELNPFPHPFP